MKAYTCGPTHGEQTLSLSLSLSPGLSVSLTSSTIASNLHDSATTSRLTISRNRPSAAASLMPSSCTGRSAAIWYMYTRKLSATDALITPSQTASLRSSRERLYMLSTLRICACLSTFSLSVLLACLTPRPYLNHFGNILGSFWDQFGVTLGSFWDHFGVTLISFWGHFGVTLGSFWDHVGIMLGSCWDHFGITLASLWGHFWI